MYTIQPGDGAAASSSLSVGRSVDRPVNIYFFSEEGGGEGGENRSSLENKAWLFKGLAEMEARRGGKRSGEEEREGIERNRFVTVELHFSTKGRRKEGRKEGRKTRSVALSFPDCHFSSCRCIDSERDIFTFTYVDCLLARPAFYVAVY